MTGRAPVVIGGDGLPQQIQPGDDLAWTGAAWTAFTPTVTAGAGTINSYTIVSAAYRQVGKTVFFRATVIINDAGTSSGFNIVSLPVAARGNPTGSGAEGNLTGKMLLVFGSGSSVQVRYFDGSFAGGTNAYLYVSGFYEAA